MIKSVAAEPLYVHINGDGGSFVCKSHLQEDTFEGLEKTVKQVLADPLMDKANWETNSQCWAKAYLVSFINRALVLKDERKKVIIAEVLEYASSHNYVISVRA